MVSSLLLAIPFFLTGASIGSFLNVVADRLPAGQSLVRPRSACPACGHELSNLDLIPIVSYLGLRGKCRYCKAHIPARIAVIEAITGLLFAGLYLQFGFGLDYVLLAAGASLLVAVAIIDLEHQLILNKILLPSAIVFLLVAPFWGEAGLGRSFPGIDSEMLASFANSVASGAGGYLVFALIVLVYPQGMGGGDVKYAGVLGLLLGMPAALVAFWVASVVGGVIAIFLLATRRKGRKDLIPYGVFMSLGGLVALWAGDDIFSWYRGLVY